MQKAKQIFEAYVQWIALGLGFLWIGWVGYAYWLSKPVKTEIDGRMFGPSEVDEYIARTEPTAGPIAQLNAAIKGDLKIPTDIEKVFNHPEKAPQYAALFKNDMALNDFAAPPIVAMWPNGGKMVEAPPDIDGPGNIQSPLPVLPPETVIATGISTGMSVVLRPDPTAAVNPADPAQKVMAPPANNPVAKPVVLAPKEVTWVTFLAKVDMKKVTAAFTTAHIPDAAAFTLFLRTRLVRQEQLPDGSWGPEVFVDDLANQSKLPWPPALGTPEEGVYLGWAETAVADIMQPAFYEVVRGNFWRTVAMPDAGVDPNAAPPVPAAFDPATVKPADLAGLNADQRKLYQDYKIQKAKDDADKRKADAEARKARSGAGGGTRNPSPAPPPLGGEALAGRRNDGRSVAAPAPGMERGVPAPFNPNPAPGVNGVIGGDMPAGKFAPATAKDVDVWSHDETTVAGHTYHYKLQVILKNPLFATRGMAVNAADQLKIGIAAESAWSEPVQSPRRQYFFATTPGNALGGNPSMKFDYFWWTDGDWKKATLDLHPGDAIKQPGEVPADAPPPWTLVDFRPVGGAGENRAIIVNEAGEIETRFYKADQASADYKRLSGLIKPATATATP